MKKNSRRNRAGYGIALSGLAVTLLIFFLYLLKSPFFQLFDHKLYDIYLKNVRQNKGNLVREQSGRSAIMPEPVIVDIDEQSLRRFGQWPWPRYHVTNLLQKIHQAGALAIGIDILFAEPDRTSPVIVKQALKENFQVAIDLSTLTPEQMDNDLYLSDILKQTPAVLGYYFRFLRQADLFAPQTLSVFTPSLPDLKANLEFGSGLLPEPDLLHRYLFHPVDAALPLSTLLAGINKNNTSVGAGYMNTISDEDGVLRRTPPRGFR